MGELGMSSTVRAWWKEGVGYQVWPLSFNDSNNDGNGDIPGIISKLDYLQDLGVDYIWLSPMYSSPRNDYGYDISNYEDVEPIFGTLQDMDDLIAGVKSRGMRLILDLVVNHTSDQHKWFQESAKSKDNEFSDYYMWRDPKIVDGKKQPPNNWRALFGGSAWKYVEARDQYFLHLFLPTMPDLNWELEKVRKAIYKSAIEFWLDRGIAGFRVDVVNLYSKDLSFPDAPISDPTEEFQPPTEDMITNGPRMHEWLQEQRTTVLDKYGKDIVLVGELGDGTMDQLKQYLNPIDRELNTIFNFDVFRATGVSFEKPWPEWEDRRSLVELRKGLMKPQSFITELGCWCTTFFENHDVPRSTNNFGSRNPEFHWQSAKLLALILASMSGTLFVYQGQEIGMRNIPKDWDRSELRDPFWLDFLNDADRKYPNNPEMHQKALDIFDRCGRDHARTPVQWTREEPYAGFSTVKPWIRVNDNFREGINVQEQLENPDSLHAFWREVIKFRKSWPESLVYGHTQFIDNDNEHILSFVKNTEHQGEGHGRLLVVMNYSDDVRPFPALDQAELNGEVGRVLFGTTPGSRSGDLQPWEGRVFELSDS